MQSLSSNTSSFEHAPAKKSKLHSQREYRYKQVNGFSELRDALLLVDPFGTPLGRDATRPQLLIAAAKKLLNLAEENQKLLLQLSAIPGAELVHDHATRNSPEIIIPLEGAASASDVWSTQGSNTEYFPSMASAPVSPLGEYSNISPTWIQSSCPFHGHEHQSYDTTLRPAEQVLQVMPLDMWQFR